MLSALTDKMEEISLAQTKTAESSRCCKALTMYLCCKLALAPQVPDQCQQ